ncbi:MAG: tRNA (N(6)-L-threonylcarbamoyladenosine(37)-C(2))-methylthiotransferase MtaB [Elusimicrobiota bacterium]|jgi:threonylcarbamoyladenosine tRNA methylthiotransferase MtaB
MSSKTIAFHTFGCKVNQYETEELRSLLHSGDFQVVPEEQAADVYVINSCTVTEEADRSCRQLIRKLLREHPEARVLVTGCYAERSAVELRAVSPRVEVFGNREKPLVAVALGMPASCIENAARRDGVLLADRTRATIKIQDGCDGPCTYCIVPSVRPVMVCRPPTLVLDEARTYLARGFREIVLTGVRLGRYEWTGDDVPWDLATLIQRLTELPGDFRIRLSSIEVTEMSNALIALAASQPKLCPFFHIPLQSGDDRVLKRMGRWYTAGRYRSLIHEIRRRIPDVALSTDVIVGFPGEEQEHFENTKRFLMEEAFSRIHVFRYSVRPGTPAERLSDQVNPQTKSQRCRTLLQLDLHLRQRFANRFLNRPVRVLLESLSSGYTEHYVRVRSRDPIPEGEFRTIHPTEIGSDAVLIA